MWLAYALGASVVWGLMYVLSEQLYKAVSVPTVLAIQMVAAAIATVGIALLTGGFREDISTMLSSRFLLWLMFASIVGWIAAEFLIAFSIVEKNASLAGLIEISYPLFIVLFSFLLFQQTHLTLATSIGALLIFIGVGIIFFYGT